MSSDLTEFLINCGETILDSDPNSKLIISGDINQFDIKPLLNHLCMKQLVKIPTRRDIVLDVYLFMTNAPHLWRKVSVRECLVRSDNAAVVVNPRITPVRKNVVFRDVRDQHKIAMSCALENHSWEEIVSSEDPIKKLLEDSLTSVFNTFFPIKKVRMSSRDPPYMSPLVKSLLNIRRKNLRKGNVTAISHIQQRINKLIRENQVHAVKSERQIHPRAAKKFKISILPIYL